MWYADNHGTITCTILKTCPQPLSVHVSLVDKRFEAEDVTLGVALVTVLPTVEVEHGAQPGSTLHELVNVPIALTPPPPPTPTLAPGPSSLSTSSSLPASPTPLVLDAAAPPATVERDGATSEVPGSSPTPTCGTLYLSLRLVVGGAPGVEALAKPAPVVQEAPPPPSPPHGPTLETLLVHRTPAWMLAPVGELAIIAAQKEAVEATAWGAERDKDLPAAAGAGAGASAGDGPRPRTVGASRAGRRASVTSATFSVAPVKPAVSTALVPKSWGILPSGLKLDHGGLVNAVAAVAYHPVLVEDALRRLPKVIMLPADIDAGRAVCAGPLSPPTIVDTTSGACVPVCVLVCAFSGSCPHAMGICGSLRCDHAPRA